MASPTEELSLRLSSLFSAGTATQWLALVGSLLCVWLVMRAVRERYASADSVWFGERVFDGVMFPLASLGLVLAWRWVLGQGKPQPVLDLALPVLASLLLIRVVVRVLGVAFPSSHVVAVFGRTVSWLVWGGLILWLSGLLPLIYAALDKTTWKLGGATVSLASIIEAALSAFAVLLLALWVSAAIESRLLKGATTDLSVRKIAANAVRALLLLVGLLLALSAAGIPLGALSVLGGALGVGLGFGLQKLASNYVSGFVILAERSVRIGDMVKVDGFEGRITDINTRYTVVRALNGRESIVPNELLITQRVENSSLADRNVLLSTTVQVAYGTDLDVLMPKLTEAVAGVKRVVANPGPAVQLANFAADGLELVAYFWIADPENGQSNVRSDVNLAVLRVLNQLGIEIPYPQRVVRQAN
jgi:small-conductance mechanosensitive channel